MDTIPNGKTRKTLSEQIDKLSSILDGLSDNLNAAVADAVREATGAAVQDAVQKALVEVLTTPDVLTLLGGLAAPRPPAPEPSAPPPEEDSRPGLRDRLGAAAAWAGRQARAAGQACVGGARGLKAGGRGGGGLRPPPPAPRGPGGAAAPGASFSRARAGR